MSYSDSPSPLWYEPPNEIEIGPRVPCAECRHQHNDHSADTGHCLQKECVRRHALADEVPHEFEPIGRREMAEVEADAAQDRYDEERGD